MLGRNKELGLDLQHPRKSQKWWPSTLSPAAGLSDPGTCRSASLDKMENFVSSEALASEYYRNNEVENDGRRRHSGRLWLQYTHA